jgi:CubicO group peptidase (beta-lactamase class C family)
VVLRVRVPAELVAGEVEEGYGRVADAFRSNFASGHEIGAALAVYANGVKVVDLWGGFHDGVSRRPWREDTIVNVFSTTKGMSALTIALAVSQGLLNYDSLVADYWPEFAENGKDTVTVRQLLAHEAGLPVVGRLALTDLADPERLGTVLATQKPAWPPGTAHGYHGITLGWYEAELLRRVDPSRRTLGRFLADELADPLGLDFRIGLPVGVDRGRIATLHGSTRLEPLLHMRELPTAFVLGLLNPGSLTARSFANPEELNRAEAFNRDDVRALEIPAGNGHGTARSIAAAYGCFASGGTELALRQEVLSALKTPLPSSVVRKDRVLRVETGFSLGFVKPLPATFCFGSADSAFGHAGLGGSFAFADPETGVGYAYVMNRMGFRLWSDPRELALRQAVFRDVLGVRPQI